MTGRKSEFTQGMADRICSRMVEGESLRSICRDEEMPVISTVMKWVSQFPEFAAQYARAQEDRANAMAEEILSISDEENLEDVQRAKLRIDTRKWLMAKMAPKKYGDKLELSGDQDAPLQVVVQKFSDGKSTDTK